MPRSSNLDVIAPDDPILSTATSRPVVNTPIPTPTPINQPQPAIIPDPVATDPALSASEELKQKTYELMGHAKHSWSSFLVNPKVFKFSEQDDDEQILLVLRPHWFTNVRWIIITIIMLFAPIAVKFVPLLAFFPPNYQLLFFIVWYTITFIYAFESFLSWYFDVFIVTNERVIDIEFNNLLNKKFSEAGIEMIQDTTYTVTGIAQTMFNFGDVLIQTAAEINQITFEKVPNPGKVIQVLQHLREEANKHHDH